MSISCVEARDLLPETVPYFRRIEALSGYVETNLYRNGIVLAEPSEARRDRLTTIIESEWQTKVIALASVEEWLKLCDYVPADLVFLSPLNSRSATDRVYDIAQLRDRKPSARIFTILERYAGSPPPADEPLQLKFIFEELNIV